MHDFVPGALFTIVSNHFYRAQDEVGAPVFPLGSSASEGRLSADTLGLYKMFRL